MIKTILISCRNQKFLAAWQVSLICLTLFSFNADAYSDSIILDMEPEVIYGNDIKIAGTVFFDEINFHAGIPASMEIRDDTGNVIDAQPTLPNRDGTFYFVVSGDKIKAFEGMEKRFAVTVYYGSPNPSLLNTKYSTTDSVKVVKISKGNNSIQNILQEIDVDQSNLKQDTVAQTADTIPEYPTNLLIIITAVVLVPILVILVRIIKSRRMWKKAELLAAKANKKIANTTMRENYIR